MSRFGIRSKLKSLMKSDKPTYEIYSVTYVLPDGTEETVEVEERYNLLMASQTLPSPIGTGRRAGGSCPDGKCASCQVEILDATGLTEMTDSEKESLDNYVLGTDHERRSREPGAPYTPNTRLGCYAKIIGSGARVQISSLVDCESLRGSN
jgi:ferredoxin